MSVVNPATEQILGEYQMDTASTVKTKFERAKAAQKNWKTVGLGLKKQIFTNFRQKLSTNKDQLASLLSSEMGKPISQAKGEISATLTRIDWFLTHVDQVAINNVVFETPGWSAHKPNQMQEMIQNEPLGVIANISAWNYPWFVGTNVFVPALLTGNAVLYKPSEHALLTGLAIGRLLLESGLPDDLFPVIVGGGEVGGEILKHSVNGVFFTGSVQTGQRITNSIANRWTRLQLELGGKDPAYVRSDANMEHAVGSLVEGAFYNTGQSCCSVERIYVEKSSYSRFTNAYIQNAKSLVTGSPSDPDTFVGPLARQEQIAVLEDQVKDAVSKGGKVVVGGKPTKINGKGYFFEPTVVIDCNHSMKLMKDESFGPIIGIQSVESDQQALELMNDTEYGLTSSVYTMDRTRAIDILSHLETGTAYWNTSDRVSPHLPWSGRRNSGIGVTLSLDGIRTFTQPRGWHLLSNPKV